MCVNVATVYYNAWIKNNKNKTIKNIELNKKTGNLRPVDLKYIQLSSQKLERWKKKKQQQSLLTFVKMFIKKS